MTNILQFHIQFPKFGQNYEVKFSPGLHLIFGESGVAIVTRIMGLILATIGVEMLLEGLMEIVGRNKEFFL